MPLAVPGRMCFDDAAVSTGRLPCAEVVDCAVRTLAVLATAGLGVFAPPLDAAGNSVKGQLVARHLSAALGLNLFVSKAEQTKRTRRKRREKEKDRHNP